MLELKFIKGPNCFFQNNLLLWNLGIVCHSNMKESNVNIQNVQNTPLGRVSASLHPA